MAWVAQDAQEQGNPPPMITSPMLPECKAMSHPPLPEVLMAQQEKELKAIKDIDKQTEEKWQVISKRHAKASLGRWEDRLILALALDAPRH